ncbi:MAG: nucleotide exchange factor GrpE [Ruminococcaceae bacterium]|nr:nucleotide exchange factor GrpE [Oscillospiraceae bacterium]
MEEIKTEQNAQEKEQTCECAGEEKKSKKCSKKDTERALQEEIERLKAEIKEKDDKYLRMAAEYDNFRRRSREEKDATYEIAMADTVSEFLMTVDNLERAAFYDDAEKVKEGLVMIAKSLESVFSKLGVEEVGKVGEKFDPNLHNAVMHIDDDSYGEGEIVEVFQKGYKKGGRIIRFAMVKTAN